MKKLIIFSFLITLSLFTFAGIGMSKKDLENTYSINIDSIINKSNEQNISISINNFTLIYNIDKDLVIKQYNYVYDYGKIKRFNEILYNNYKQEDNIYLYQNNIYVKIYEVEYFNFHIIEFFYK